MFSDRGKRGIRTLETRKRLHAFQANKPPSVKRVILYKAWDYIPSYGIVLSPRGGTKGGQNKKGPKLNVNSLKL